MGKVTTPLEFYVVIDVDMSLVPTDRWEQYGRARANEIKDRIRKAYKADFIDDIEDVRIETEQAAVCEFCGSDWTEGDSPHNGGCCEQDAAIMEEQDAE